MGGPALAISGLGKRYHRGEREAYGSLRQRLAGLLCRPGGAAADPGWMWALRGVDATIAQGELVGVIGRNGSGKSTLLKILARITRPTCGQAVVSGRVGSLLEVGTGFHPELTGRENIFLNGTILGMDRATIRRSFAEIVAFAELEAVIDAPVKRYSTGMAMRLAFAVAAHLDAEVMLLDEVLAVGDAAFQRKCLGKMADLTRSGRTILLVSHQLGAIRRLCRRTLWIDAGTLRADGATAEVIAGYTRSLDAAVPALPAGDADFRWQQVRLTQGGEARTVVFNGEPLRLELDYTVLRPLPGLRLVVDVLDDHGELLMRSHGDDALEAPLTAAAGRYLMTAEIPANLLIAGGYQLAVRALLQDGRDLGGHAIPIRVQVEHSAPVNRAFPHLAIAGRVLPNVVWSTRARP